MLSAQQNFNIYFEEFSLKGSTTIDDLTNDTGIFTDSTNAYIETLPASTFIILNSLIALKAKTICDNNEVIKWDASE